MHPAVFTLVAAGEQRTPEIPPLRQFSGAVEPARYTVWVKAPAHGQRIEGVSYDAVPTTCLKAPPTGPVRGVLRPRRPTGWVRQKLDAHGPDRSVLPAGL